MRSASATLRSWCALPRSERALVIQAAILLLFACAALRWLPDRALHRLLIFRPAARTPATASHQRLLALVEATAAGLPCRSTCLARALVSKWMLERRGVAASLIIAVKTRDRFSAHAWVEVSDSPSTPVADREIWRHP